MTIPIEDDSDQALVATDHCIKWGCDKAPLVKRGRFWSCPRCGSSYGEHPHPRLNGAVDA